MLVVSSHFTWWFSWWVWARMIYSRVQCDFPVMWWLRPLKCNRDQGSRIKVQYWMHSMSVGSLNYMKPSLNSPQPWTRKNLRKNQYFLSFKHSKSWMGILGGNKWENRTIMALLIMPTSILTRVSNMPGKHSSRVQQPSPNLLYVFSLRLF